MSAKKPKHPPQQSVNYHSEGGIDHERAEYFRSRQGQHHSNHPQQPSSQHGHHPQGGPPQYHQVMQQQMYQQKLIQQQQLLLQQQQQQEQQAQIRVIQHGQAHHQSSAAHHQLQRHVSSSSAGSNNSTSGVGNSVQSSTPVSSPAPSNSGTTSHVGASLRAIDLVPLLRERLALLPGGRDRRGGPILCFPSNSRADEIPIENVYLLVRYLTFLPDERVKKLGFTVIIDMRSGTTWHSVKPILKVLEECVGNSVNITFIIKPDKFLEKQKAQMASSKYSFETLLISVDNLFKEVDPSQLTTDFEGSLPYNHEEWIQLRCRLEDFFSKAHDLWNKLHQIFKALDRKDDPKKMIDAKQRLEEHRSFRLKILQAPVPLMEEEAEKLTQWLKCGLTAHQINAGVDYLGTSWVAMNPDFQQLLPQVKQTVVQLYEFRAHLQQTWEVGRTRLEQIYQKCLFDDDLKQMSEWLEQQRHVFLTQYLDIGNTASQAADLHVEHRHFLGNCSNVREQVARLTGVATMLADSGHYARNQIIADANQLDHEWRSLTTALEDRSRVLQLSASFHARAEAFLANCPHWDSAMRNIKAETIHELNQAVVNLQELWHEAAHAHEEVCIDGRALANHLTSPVPSGSHTSLTATVDYSEGRKHCTDLMHELWTWFKQLENVYNDRKKRLSSRLAVLMFKEDVCQVLAWLSDHGEPFLSRQTAIGKSSQRAEQLYNAHMQFEQVAANTLTNAEKLITAADELSAHAADPEEIMHEATELRRRINAFTSQVAQRRETLDLACGFYSHTKELFNCWFHHLRQSHNPGEHLPPTIEGMEDEINAYNRFRNSVENEAERVLREGETILDRVIEQDEQLHIKNVLEQVIAERATAADLFTERQVRLDLCLQLRLFEADVAAAMECIRQDVPSSNDIVVQDPRQAPDLDSLEEASAMCLATLHTAEEVLSKGGELAVAFDSVAVNFPAGGPGSSDSGVGDSVESAVERIQRLVTELAEAVSTVDELRLRLSAELEWRRLEQHSKQVLHWIGNCEAMLRVSAVIPRSLTEADVLSGEHERFRTALNDAHPEAVACAARAELVLQMKDHPRTSETQATMESLTARWRGLVYAAEEKHKLIIAANNWYKTSDQVMSVLTSLEKEYRREEDWCQSEKAIASGDPVKHLDNLLTKHGEQKEAFLKACILARRTSDHFTKYLHRQPPGVSGKNVVEERIREAMTQLMSKEQSVLEAWAARKRRYNECLSYVTIKREADKVLARPLSDGSGQQSQLNQSTQKEDEIQRLLAQLKGFEWNLHQKGCQEISARLEQAAQVSVPEIRNKESTGRSTEVRSTDSALTTSSTVSSSSVSSSDQQNKMARRREKILNELIQTEKTYVNDLKQCLDAYFHATRKSPSPEIQIPSGIVGREKIIFANMPDIYDFHRDIFSLELEKYIADFLPEDVGHCFVRYYDQLASLYVAYCVNKVESTQLVIEEAGTFYQEVQNHYSLCEPLQSYLIKPVQRITKYQLILKELFDCCDPGSAGEIKEGMESMLAVPKKANDALHLSMLNGLPEDSVAPLGEVILQDQFTVWDPKQLIKKGRERRVFLFDACLIIAKEIPSLPGEHKGRYQYKSRLLLPECNITEHIEGDQCKFALWTGRVPVVDYKLILKAATLEVKQTWVRAFREALQERMLIGPSLYRSETNKTDSGDTNEYYLLEDYKATNENELTVSINQRVELIEQSGDWAQVRVCGEGGHTTQGFVPANILSRKLANQSSGRRGSTSQLVKKWLPIKERRIGKRGSKVEIQPQQQLAARAAAAAAAPAPAQPNPVESVLDNVSEESVEVELPPPMQLQEYPPPVTTSGNGSGPECSTGQNSPGLSEVHSEASMENIQDDSCDTLGSDIRFDQQQQDELGLALEKNLRLSRRSRRNAEQERRARPHAIIQDDWCSTPTPGEDAGSAPHNAPSIAGPDWSGAGISPGGGVTPIEVTAAAGEVAARKRQKDSSRCAGESLSLSPLSSRMPLENTPANVESSASENQSLSENPDNDTRTAPTKTKKSGRSSGLRKGSGTTGLSLQNPPSDELKVKLLKKRTQAVLDLVQSEDNYLNSCLFIVRNKFMPALESGDAASLPEDLKSQWDSLLSNWSKLCDLHSFLFEKLSQITVGCNEIGENINMDSLPLLFIENASQFKTLYSQYVEEHHQIQHLLTQYADTLEELSQNLDEQSLLQLLVQPIQRPSRYQQALTEVVKATNKLLSLPEYKEEAIHWSKALQLVKNLNHSCQVISEASRITDYPNEIASLGDLRLRGDLKVSIQQGHEESEFDEFRVFLFEQAVLITKSQILAQQSEQCIYHYRYCIHVNSMNIVAKPQKTQDEFQEGNESPSENHVFKLEDRESEITYFMSAIDETSRELWVTHLTQLQKLQKVFQMQAIKSPDSTSNDLATTNSQPPSQLPTRQSPYRHAAGQQNQSSPSRSGIPSFQRNSPGGSPALKQKQKQAGCGTGIPASTKTKKEASVPAQLTSSKKEMKQNKSGDSINEPAPSSTSKIPQPQSSIPMPSGIPGPTPGSSGKKASSGRSQQSIPTIYHHNHKQQFVRGGLPSKSHPASNNQQE